MKTRTKKVYVADDGTEFDTADEAIRHENKVKFKDLYEHGGVSFLYGYNCSGSQVDGDNLINWMFENKFEILNLLSK